MKNFMENLALFCGVIMAGVVGVVLLIALSVAPFLAIGASVVMAIKAWNGTL